jgi:Flavodoxin
MMKALVVYESMFGNTEQIARAVADGLGESVEVQLTDVSDAPLDPDPDLELIVVGGPTHAFSMSRTRTRADAISRGGRKGESEFGLREWLSALPSGPHTEKIATFDTKVEGMHHYPAQPQRAPPKLLAVMAMRPPRKPKAFTLTTSTVRYWKVKLIEREPGGGNSLHQSALPPEDGGAEEGPAIRIAGAEECSRPAHTTLPSAVDHCAA